MWWCNVTHLTLLSSFWYCGIFFSIWDRSLIVVYRNKQRCHTPTAGNSILISSCIQLSFIQSLLQEVLSAHRSFWWHFTVYQYSGGRKPEDNNLHCWYSTWLCPCMNINKRLQIRNLVTRTVPLETTWLENSQSCGDRHTLVTQPAEEQSTLRDLQSHLDLMVLAGFTATLSVPHCTYLLSRVHPLACREILQWASHLPVSMRIKK